MHAIVVRFDFVCLTAKQCSCADECRPTSSWQRTCDEAPWSSPFRALDRRRSDRQRCDRAAATCRVDRRQWRCTSCESRDRSCECERAWSLPPLADRSCRSCIRTAADRQSSRRRRRHAAARRSASPTPPAAVRRVPWPKESHPICHTHTTMLPTQATTKPNVEHRTEVVVVRLFYFELRTNRFDLWRENRFEYDKLTSRFFNWMQKLTPTTRNYEWTIFFLAIWINQYRCVFQVVIDQSSSNANFRKTEPSS